MKTIVAFALLAMTSVAFAWEPSPDFIRYMKSVEGYRAKPYKDCGGVWHIGYGHRITPQDARRLFLTEGDATKLLVKDLKAAYSKVGHNFEGARAEMAVDFYFNGCTRAMFPRFFAALNRGDYPAMRREYKRYVNGRELKWRNKEFYARYLSYGNS